jgi:hypothetical protein
VCRSDPSTPEIGFCSLHMEEKGEYRKKKTEKDWRKEEYKK